VPAEAEIVIEGRFLPGVREPEGPFGEFPQYYGARADREVMEMVAVTHRKDAIFHTIVGGGLEHLVLGAIPKEATLLAHLRRNFPNVLDVHLSPGGVMRYHLFVKLRKDQEGQGKNVILGAFAGSFDLKHVIVVDEDVDIHNPTEVEWAVATRFQADRDLVIVPESQGSKLDPSTVPPHRHHLRRLWRRRGRGAADPVRHHPAHPDRRRMGPAGARPRAARQGAQRLPRRHLRPREILQGRHRPRRPGLRNPAFRPEMNGQPLPHDIYVHIAGIDIVRVDADDLLRARGQCAHAVRRLLHAGEPGGDDAAVPDLFSRHRVAPVENYPDELLATLRSWRPRSARPIRPSCC
jgi:hypothetical protein